MLPVLPVSDVAASDGAALPEALASLMASAARVLRQARELLRLPALV